MARFTWIFRVFNPRTMDLGGKPTKWWSILPFTSTLELKQIYSCKLYRRPTTHFVPITVYWLSIEFPLLDHRKTLTDLDVISTENRYHKESRMINITTTRILPPARPIPCSNSKYYLTVITITSGWNIFLIRQFVRFLEDLPPLRLLYSQIFERTPEQQFKPDPKRRNLLFHTFYQYFVMQFLNSDFNMTVKLYIPLINQYI